MLECGFGGHLEFNYDKVIKIIALIFEFCSLNSAYKLCMFADFNMNCTRKPFFGHKHIH